MSSDPRCRRLALDVTAVLVLVLLGLACMLLSGLLATRPRPAPFFLLLHTSIEGMTADDRGAGCAGTAGGIADSASSGGAALPMHLFSVPTTGASRSRISRLTQSYGRYPPPRNKAKRRAETPRRAARHIGKDQAPKLLEIVGGVSVEADVRVARGPKAPIRLDLTGSTHQPRPAAPIDPFVARP